MVQEEYLPGSLYFRIGCFIGKSILCPTKPVTVVVDGKVIESKVFFASTVADVLEKNDIKLGDKDEINPSLDTVVKKNTEITITRAFKVKVIADGETREVISTPVTVKEAIKLAGFQLGEKDIVKTVPTEKTIPDQRSR